MFFNVLLTNELFPSTSADIWPAWDRKEDEGEPEWIANEKEHFTKHRDKDGDQRINRVGHFNVSLLHSLVHVPVS